MVIKLEVFKELSFEVFIRLFKSDEFNVYNESEVFCFVFFWIRYDFQLREKLFFEVLKYVWFLFICKDYLINIVKSDVLF